MTEKPRPSVSIIIAAYNRPGLLREAIASALSQTCGPEVIVVDDGSTVDLSAARRGFGDRVLWERKANGGQASARNRGLSLASGETVLFLDDDDFLEPEGVTRLLEALEASPEYQWAAGRFHYVDAEGRRLPIEHRCSYSSGDVYERLIGENLIGAPSCVLARAEVIRSLGGFDESPACRTSEDYDLWLTLARDYPLLAVPHKVTNYRMHEGRGTLDWARHHEACLFTLRKQRERARPGLQPHFDQSIAREHIAYGDEHYMRGRESEARAQWREALRQLPGARWSLAGRFVRSRLPRAWRRSLRGVPVPRRRTAASLPRP